MLVMFSVGTYSTTRFANFTQLFLVLALRSGQILSMGFSEDRKNYWDSTGQDGAW